MRVLHYCNWGSFAPISCGADVIASNQLEYFRHRGWEVDCLIADKAPRAHQARSFEALYPWVRSIRLIDHPIAPLTLRGQLFAHQQIAESNAFRTIAGEGYDLFFTNYVFTAPLLEAFPAGCKRVLEALDLMSEAFAYNEQEGDPCVDALATARKSLLLDIECELFRLFDGVLFINEDERRQAESAARARLFTVPPMMPWEVESDGPSAAGRPEESYDLIFVGSNAHMNTRGFTHFYRQIYLPFLRSRGIRVAVVGSVCDALEFEDHQVTKLGYVSGNLEDCYARSRIVIIPILYGSGLSIKTIECLAHGRAVVTTPMGCRGLVDEPGAFVRIDMESDPRGTAEVILGLLDSEEKRRLLQRRAKAYYLSHFSREQYFRKMDRVMESLGLIGSHEVAA
ncbi:MAG: glycosyltransferase family 4 protein [Isosphaeraceae bacterium]